MSCFVHRLRQKKLQRQAQGASSDLKASVHVLFVAFTGAEFDRRFGCGVSAVGGFTWSSTRCRTFRGRSFWLSGIRFFCMFKIENEDEKMNVNPTFGFRVRV